MSGSKEKEKEKGERKGKEGGSVAGSANEKKELEKFDVLRGTSEADQRAFLAKAWDFLQVWHTME